MGKFRVRLQLEEMIISSVEIWARILVVEAKKNLKSACFSLVSSIFGDFARNARFHAIYERKAPI